MVTEFRVLNYSREAREVQPWKTTQSSKGQTIFVFLLAFLLAIVSSYLLISWPGRMEHTEAAEPKTIFGPLTRLRQIKASEARFTSPSLPAPMGDIENPSVERMACSTDCVADRPADGHGTCRVAAW